MRGNDTHTSSNILDMVVIAGSMGLTLFVSICVGLFIGHGIDSFFHLTPWGLISFGLLGAASGFWSLYKKAVSYMESHDVKGKPGGND